MSGPEDAQGEGELFRVDPLGRMILEPAVPGQGSKFGRSHHVQVDSALPVVALEGRRRL